MSNPISEARTDVAEVLRAIDGLSVFDYIPAKLVVPKAAIVHPGSPYVTPGRVFGEYEVSLTVRLLSRSSENGRNDIVTKALDDLIVSAVEALYQFGVISVERPGRVSDWENTYLSTDITITTNYKGGH